MVIRRVHITPNTVNRHCLDCQPDDLKNNNIICRHQFGGSCSYGKDCRYVHVCLYFLRGTCRFGEKCTLPHILLCTHFAKLGYCDYDNRCKFPHITHVNSTGNINNNITSTSPPPISTSPSLILTSTSSPPISTTLTLKFCLKSCWPDNKDYFGDDLVVNFDFDFWDDDDETIK